MADRKFLEQLTRRLIDEGKLMEAGWISLRLAAIPLDASPTQLTDMRIAFMCGAQHLLNSLMMTFGPDHEPTDDDMRRVSLIDAELRVFAEELKLRVAKTEGSA